MERRSELDAQAVGEAGSDVTRGDTDVVLDTLGINDALPAADKLAAAGAVAGFAAYRDHCSYLPMSGTVLSRVADEVAGYSTSKGALKFPVDQPLPDVLVTTLVRARQAEIAGTNRP